MMKRLFAMAAFLAVSMNGFAASQDDPWSFTGEFLYFKPSFDDTYFVINNLEGTANVVRGKRVANTFDFEPGFRVAAAYNLCGCDCPGEIGISYAYLDASTNKTVSGDRLSPTVGMAGFLGQFVSNFDGYEGTAKSSLKVRYQRGDLTFTQPLCSCNCLNVSFKAGLEVAELKLKEHYTFNNLGNTSVTQVEVLKHKSDVTAIGPEMGFLFDYPVIRGTCECPGTLSLRAETTGSLLAGKQRGSVVNTNFINDVATGYDVGFSDCKVWRVIPALHARLGVNYAFAVECFEGNVEAGYEFTSYIRGVSRTIYPDDVAVTQSFNRYCDFDLQGLYVSATLNF